MQVDPLATSNTPTFGPQQLGRDEFLQLLVAKLENQDPLDPAKDTEFVAQLATFSSLEQLIQVNDNLQTLGLSQGQLLNAQALGLIGKDALVAGDAMRVHDGTPEAIVYQVPRDASEVTLEIRNAEGHVVRTLNLPAVPGERQTLAWDGLDSDGEPLADGEYQLSVRATDADGDPMEVPIYRTLRIDGVSFASGMVVLISGGREIPLGSILEIREGR